MPRISIFHDILHLFYPVLCAACEKEAIDLNQLFCIGCEHKLVQTNFHSTAENECTNRLEGRFPFMAVCAMFRFQPGGLVQSMIHKIKYRNQPDIAFRLGHRYGAQLAASSLYQNVDLIIPVPLHKHKRRQRGYNQSDYWANGLAYSMHTKVEKKILVRRKNTDSQTHKSKVERLENLTDAFYIKNPQAIAHKHLLLVDDVLTTGATLESCALELLKHHPVSLRIATIALAD